MVDYSQGEGNKRLRKRNKKPTKAQLARMALVAEEQAHHQQGASAGPSNTNRSDSEGSQGSGPETIINDSMIDPVLTAQSGHRVGTQRSVRSTRSSTRLNSPYLSGARVQGTASASPEPSSGVGGFPRLPSLGSSGQPAFGQSSLIQQSSARSSIIQPPSTTFGQTANIQAHATSSSRESRVPSSSGLGASGFTQYQSHTQSFLPPSAQLPSSSTRVSGSSMGSHRRTKSNESSDGDSS